MYKVAIEKNKINFDKVIIHFREELGKIRTGRASSAMVENLAVEYYESRTPLKQIATISIPESRTISITPWDKSSLSVIEKAFRESDLGLNPINDGQMIRINVPTLTEERRRDFVKVLNGLSESARVSIRKCREDVWNAIWEMNIGEDDKFQGKEKLQKIVDEYNADIEDIRKKKEAEIMQI
jgi:ribosome recycling factor